MQYTVTITTSFNCSLERAFKTPMLCDVSKVHTGFAGIMPRVTHSTGDQHWGQPGYSKKIFVATPFNQKAFWATVDKVIERIENKYWKIEISDFQVPMFGFTKFTGEWATTPVKPNQIAITYTYTLHSNMALLYPVHWLITKTFWRIYMKQVLENVRKMAYSNEPYMYE